MLYDKEKAQNLRSYFKNRRERKLNTPSGLFHLLQSLHNVLFVQQCCLIFGIPHSDTGVNNFVPFFCRVCRFDSWSRFHITNLFFRKIKTKFYFIYFQTLTNKTLLPQIIVVKNIHSIEPISRGRIPNEINLAALFHL